MLKLTRPIGLRTSLSVVYRVYCDRRTGFALAPSRDMNEALPCFDPAGRMEPVRVLGGIESTGINSLAGTSRLWSRTLTGCRSKESVPSYSGLRILNALWNSSGSTDHDRKQASNDGPHVVSGIKKRYARRKGNTHWNPLQESGSRD